MGTLLTHAYSAGNCLLGAIFGTGTNGAYVEDKATLTKLSGNMAAPGDGQKMIINCEWGAFDNAVSIHHVYPKRQSSLPNPIDPQRKVLPLTPFDTKLDRHSINPYVCLCRLIRPAMCIDSSFASSQAQTGFRENDFRHVSWRDCTQHPSTSHRSTTRSCHCDETRSVSPLQWLLVQSSGHPLWLRHSLHVRHCSGNVF